MRHRSPEAGITTRLLGLCIVLLLLVAACGDDDGARTTTVSQETTVATVADTTTADTTGAADTLPATFPPGGGIDLDLVRDDVDCSAEGLDPEEGDEFLVAHYVVDGDLGAVCFGEEDPTLYEAWELLTSITATGQLNDLALFGGYVGADEGDSETLAFVNALDDEGSVFQMSVNLDAADADPNEFALTMAHEFSHVFTSLPFELDRYADPDTCYTYYNGEGCYTDDSLMAEWIATFWGDGLIDEIDPDADADPAAGQDRCDLNPGFLGAYAASSPEEDFAESFSAFVFQIPVDEAVQAKMDWFAQYPGLVEFQDRAAAAGLSPLENNFDYCGAAA